MTPGELDRERRAADGFDPRPGEGVRPWNRNSLLKGFTLGLSIGIQEYDGTQSFDDVLTAADARTYAEKNAQSGAGPPPAV